ncbi:MAG: ATP-binding protein [Gemmataceae bacterium]
MTLTNRLTYGSVAALALVLTGFCVAIYWSAHNHLHRRAEERLAAAAQVLVASCEIKPDGVEWESEERNLGFHAGAEGICWIVTDADGRLVDESGPPHALAEAAARMRTTNQSLKKIRDDTGSRLVLQEIVSGAHGTPFSPPVGKQRKFPSLVVTVGLSLDPVRSALNELAAILAVFSVGIWLAAATAGRTLCRWALKPVIHMADAASRITATDLSVRLPTPSTRDELSVLGSAFNELLGRVEQTYLRQRNFTAEASHQLRTPIAALLGQVEVALRRNRDAAEYQQTLESVQRQGDRLRRVVESLLFLARSEADAVLPDRESIELSSWLSEHLRERWSSHARYGEIQIDAIPTHASVHQVLLAELVDVLIDNALKYSPAGTSIRVRVRSEVGVELTVEDQGPGIATGDLGRLFDPFVRAESARLQGVEGTGLGLAVARRIAEAHGGTLEAMNIPGAGSRFMLWLPL